MAEVHKAISAHSQKQHEVVTTFAQLDAQREAAIEAALSFCMNGQPFSVETINAVTKEMNALAQKYGYVPVRKYVTAEMVHEYAERVKQTKTGE